MKEALLTLFQLLIKLGRLPCDEESAIARTREQIIIQKDTIDTMHGDSDFNDLEVVEAIDDLVEVLATSTPSDDYADLPDPTEDNDDLSSPNDERVPGETEANRLKSTSQAAKDASNSLPNEPEPEATTEEPAAEVKTRSRRRK